MWIKDLPAGYSKKSSYCSNNVFLWQSGNVFVMDNHMAALWGWLQTCASKKKYNFRDEDLEPIRKNPQMSFEEFCKLKRSDGDYPVFRWDDYIMAGYVLYPDWFHTNIFLTCQEGDKGKSWGHKPMKIREENPLFMEWCIDQYIGEPSEYLDGFSGKDYKLPWIVNLDLDVFYTSDSHIKVFSDDYILRIAELLQHNMGNIAALTIAISPDCLGGDEMSDKWANGFSLLRIMSEKLDCLKSFFHDHSRIISLK